MGRQHPRSQQQDRPRQWPSRQVGVRASWRLGWVEQHCLERVTKIRSNHAHFHSPVADAVLFGGRGFELTRA